MTRLWGTIRDSQNHESRFADLITRAPSFEDSIGHWVSTTPIAVPLCIENHFNPIECPLHQSQPRQASTQGMKIKKEGTTHRFQDTELRADFCRWRQTLNSALSTYFTVITVVFPSKSTLYTVSDRSSAFGDNHVGLSYLSQPGYEI